VLEVSSTIYSSKGQEVQRNHKGSVIPSTQRARDPYDYDSDDGDGDDASDNNELFKDFVAPRIGAKGDEASDALSNTKTKHSTAIIMGKSAAPCGFGSGKTGPKGAGVGLRGIKDMAQSTSGSR